MSLYLVLAIVALPALQQAFYLSVLHGLIVQQRRTRMRTVPGVPEWVSGLDVSALDQATSEWTALGFEFVADHVSHMEQEDAAAALAAPIPPPSAGPLPPPRFESQGFGRTLLHPQHGCLARIIYSATRDRSGAVPTQTIFTVFLVSFQGLNEESWSYATGEPRYDKTGLAISKLWRHPRRLSTRLDAAPPTLLEFHLRRREQVARAAQVRWKTSFVPDEIVEIEALGMRRIRATFEGLNALQMAWRLAKLKRETSKEWLGELKGRL